MGQIVAERTEEYGYSVYNIYNRVWMQRNFSLPSTSLDDLGSICNLQYDYENELHVTGSTLIISELGVDRILVGLGMYRFLQYCYPMDNICILHTFWAF